MTNPKCTTCDDTGIAVYPMRLCGDCDVGKPPTKPLKRCHADRDGDCNHSLCPQAKNYQPHCPLDREEEEP